MSLAGISDLEMPARLGNDRRQLGFGFRQLLLLFVGQARALGLQVMDGFLEVRRVRPNTAIVLQEIVFRLGIEIAAEQHAQLSDLQQHHDRVPVL